MKTVKELSGNHHMANDGAISVLVEHMNKIIFRTWPTMVLPLTTASMHTDENKKTKIKFGTQLRKHYYCFHMDLCKVGSTRVDEPGLNLGLVLPFHMAANHCIRVASYSAKR